MATPGLDTYGARSGSPPYGESRWKAILRQAALGLGPGLQGLSAVPRGANFGEAFLSSLGASSRAYGAAQQAAQEYAMKQQQMEEDRQYRQFQEKHLEALTEQLKKPPKPEKLEPWQLPPDQQKAYIDFKARETKATAKPDKPEKPDRTELLDTNVLADNFRQEKDVQNHTVVRDNARRIEGALNQGTGYGDLAAIFAFMRVLDPNSVVRETEFANAEAASGFLQKVLNIPGKVVQGNRLTPQARIKIRSMTQNLAQTQEQTYQRTVNRYRNLAKKFKVDPSLIITDYNDSTPAPANDPLGIR